MSSQYNSLIEARDQWQSDIKMYKDFLKGESKTFEGKYGAEEYISMAENRLNDINLKLKEIEKENLPDRSKMRSPAVRATNKRRHKK